MAGGYTHGKRSEALPKPRYIEDRVATLETIVGRLIKLVGGALDREQEMTLHELAELDLKKKEYLADKKKLALKRALKKPVKRQRAARTRL